MAKYTILVIVLVSSLACSRSPQKDYTLTPEEYREMGLPDHTSTWDYEDYKEACIVLNNIKAVKPFSLPRKDSKRSEAVFSRLTDPGNLEFLMDESLSLHERAYRIQPYIDLQGCFVTVYTSTSQSEQYYNRELIDLYIFGLTIAQEMLDLGQQINESVEEEAVEMQYAYNSIRHLYITMVNFILENQQKSWFFEEKDLIRLSEFLVNSLIINREWIDDEPARDIVSRAKRILDTTDSEEIRKQYNELVDIFTL